MKEVVIIRIKDGKPIDKPIYLSGVHTCVLTYYKHLLKVVRRERDGADFLNKLFEAKRKLRNIEQALNGKYNIIVIVDLTVSLRLPSDIIEMSWLPDIIEMWCGERR